MLRRMHRRWRALRHVRSSGDLLLLISVYTFAMSVPALMRLPLTRLELLLTPRGGTRPPVDPARVEQLVRYVEGVQRHGSPLVRRQCLTRGLTLFYFLTRAGLDIRLSFGVGVIGGATVGHCWLTQDGVPCFETPDPRPLYVEMYTIPATTFVKTSATPRTAVKALAVSHAASSAPVEAPL